MVEVRHVDVYDASDSLTVFNMGLVGDAVTQAMETNLLDSRGAELGQALANRTSLDLAGLSRCVVLHLIENAHLC
jgi:hypothetical protein